EIAYHIGIAYAKFLRSKKVIVGRDVRLSSEGLCNALSEGLMDSGVDVFDIGICGTEMVYFATFYEKMGGGIMVTASHNPKDYNGMKFVREQAKPISGDSGLNIIRDMVIENDFALPVAKGKTYSLDIKEKYIEHLLGYIDRGSLRPYKVVVNAGNGCAGRIIDLLERYLPLSFIKINHEPDGAFPNGVPNPLLPENRNAIIEAAKNHNADIGIAWDGDFDRCFFFDEKGDFIEGYYIVGLIASAMLLKYPNAKIIHDPRLTWNTIDIVTKAGGVPVQSKTGHAFIKERMRLENAVYGGEMSAHHYFRDFAFCDSGMIPWLLVLEIMSKTGKKLSELVDERMKLFPVSGEINRKVDNPANIIKKIEDRYRGSAIVIDYTDGLSMEFSEWRFNLRCSNTEPVIRLNVEARGNSELMRNMTDELLGQIDA
ncbi:MAG: phosphomannomutase, partial [Nitrospirota bacterium]|nr:phosphomannomutase [Nitrospirota bacterium]